MSYAAGGHREPAQPASEADAPADGATLKELNRGYLAASVRGDVGWYEEHLASEFMCRAPDGSVLDKKAFLARTAAGSDLLEFHLHKVRVRQNGDEAIVESTGRFVRADGKTGTCRCTDLYKREAAEWKVISSHVKRILGE